MFFESEGESEGIEDIFTAAFTAFGDIEPGVMDAGEVVDLTLGEGCEPIHRPFLTSEMSP